jgi:UDP-N-acetylmuramoylalanine--D-glutamate ligase
VKPRPPLPPGPYLVVGLARSGVAAALALRRADPGAPVVACDVGRPPEAIAQAERLEAAGVEVHLDTDGSEALAAAERPRTLVKSPGVPGDAPVVAAARERGLNMTGELEIGWRLVPNEFCAVTGTNGKTTTIELIAAIHRAAGLPVVVAGNVGTPVSSYAGERKLEPDAAVVCEASSFQLEDSDRFAPEVAAFLNVADDHLDRHGDGGSYLDAKLRIFENQSPRDVAVLNADEPALSRRELGGQARRLWFGTRPDCALRLAGGKLLWNGAELMPASEVGLRGAHNLSNAMAAAAAALARGVDAGAVRSALREFAGVPHRGEEVAQIGGVLYVNDSKATNVSAAAAALESFGPGVHAILGGRPKDTRFGGLVPAVADACERCYLIGEAAERLREDLAPSGIELRPCGDLERAVTEAARAAQPGQTVLLAPACASFDQYRDFEERGEHFRALVAKLDGQSETGELPR